MPDPRVVRLLEQLRASRFAGLQGARISASIPVAAGLLNDIVTAGIPPSAAVRDVTVLPKHDNHIAVRARLALASFLPPVTVTLRIERQPQLPDSPLVLRILSLPALLSLGGGMLASALPHGIRLEDQRLLIDVAVLLDRAGYGDLAQYVETLRVGSEDGRLLFDVTLRV